MGVVCVPEAILEKLEPMREYIIMMEECGLEMDVGNARPASLESVNPIELNEHWNEEIALSLVCGIYRYPDVLPRERRRNFRKRAKDFDLWMESCTIRDLEI